MGIFFGKIFRAILMLLDDAVYGLAEVVYRLFIRIAETGIFSPESIQTFAGRIYFFLGLAMLFKVSISIIDYIMNPDSVKDNKVGASKLLKNIVIILVGIVTIPYIFEAAYSLQRIILSENVIGNLILGVKYTDSSAEEDARSFTDRAGDEMSFSIYNAFFHINEDLIDAELIASDCRDGLWEDKDNKFRDDCFPDKNLDDVKDKYIEAYNSKQRQKLTKFEIMNATVKTDNGEEFVFSYMYVVATLAGAALCYILLLFCFDIAVRSVKLGFLQLIAPIPLISKIDPKKGDEVFSKWVKECTSTYALLFIRLIAIYFAIYIISILTDTYNIVDPDVDEKNLFVNVFIIYGVLLFVKDLPKLIETLTGIKIGDGTLSLNKRLRDVPVLGKPTAEGIALGGRTMGNVFRGLNNARKSKDFKNSMGAAWDDIRNDARNYGHGMWSAGKQALGVNDRQLDRLEMEKARIMKKNQEAQSRIKRKEALANSIKKMEDRAWDQISSGQANKVNDRLNGKSLSDNYRGLVAELKEAEASGNAHAIADAQRNLDGYKQHAINEYMAHMEVDDKDKSVDKTFYNLYQDYRNECRFNGIEEADRTVLNGDGEYAAIHGLFGATKGEISEISQGIAADNLRLDEIKIEADRIQEDVKSTKPFYTAKR